MLTYSSDTYYVNESVSKFFTRFWCKNLAFYSANSRIWLPIYKIGDTTVNRVSSIKGLGVLFNENFTLSDHLESVYNKAVKTLGFITNDLWL